MKSFWKARLWLWLAILLLVGLILRPEIPISNSVGFYLGYFGVPLLVWVGIFELFYWITHWPPKREK